MSIYQLSGPKLNTYALLDLLLIIASFHKIYSYRHFTFTETNTQMTISSNREGKGLSKAQNQGLPASSLKLWEFCNSRMRLYFFKMTVCNEYWDVNSPFLLQNFTFMIKFQCFIILPDPSESNFYYFSTYLLFPFSNTTKLH